MYKVNWTETKPIYIDFDSTTETKYPQMLFGELDSIITQNPSGSRKSGIYYLHSPSKKVSFRVNYFDFKRFTWEVWDERETCLSMLSGVFSLQEYGLFTSYLNQFVAYCEFPKYLSIKMWKFWKWTIISYLCRTPFSYLNIHIMSTYGPSYTYIERFISYHNHDGI